MRLRVELPDIGVVASVTLLNRAAPTICEAIWAAVGTPYETVTSHACFDGHEVFCFLPTFPRPELENQTMRPRPGDVMFFYSGPNDFVFTQENRLGGGGKTVCELAFMYGETDLRHFVEEGMRGSLVGVIDAGLEEFSAACLRTLSSGQTKLLLSQEPLP